MTRRAGRPSWARSATRRTLRPCSSHRLPRVRDGRGGRASQSSSPRPGRLARSSARSSAERATGPSTASGSSTPMPHEPGRRDPHRTVERLDASSSAAAHAVAVLLGDDHRLAAHLDRESLADRQHRGGRGDRAARLPQAGEVDARAGEGHRRREANGIAPRRTAGSSTPVPKPRRGVHDELARRPTPRPPRGPRRAPAAPRPARRAATSSLRSTRSGIVEHGDARQHGVGPVPALLRHGGDADERVARTDERGAEHRAHPPGADHADAEPARGPHGLGLQLGASGATRRPAARRPPFARAR